MSRSITPLAFGILANSVPMRTSAVIHTRARGREAVWVILDGEDEVSTGFGASDRGGAEKALSAYLAKKHKPDWQNSHPAEVAVADVLAYYGTNRAPALALSLLGITWCRC